MAYKTAAPRRNTNFPVSPAQKTLLRRIQGERQIVLDWTAIEDGTHTVRTISGYIDDALRAPKMPAKPDEIAQPGYYTYPDLTGEPIVVVVVENKAKTGTYAKTLVIANGRAAWVYAPGLGKTIAVNQLTPLSVEEAAKLGKQHGVCCVCAKTLTDPESVERGIGPVCAKRLAPTIPYIPQPWQSVLGRKPEPTPTIPVPTNYTVHDCESFDGECLGWSGYHGNPGHPMDNAVRYGPVPVTPVGAPPAATVRPL